MPNPTRRGALACALAVLFAVAAGRAAQAQEGEAAAGRPAPRAEVNHEVQVHLLVTAEGAEAAPRVPQTLDAVVRQLKSSLPASDYRLAATFVNRVRDGGMYEVKGAGGIPFSPPPALNSPATPSFFQLAVTGVRLIDPTSAQPSINVAQFRLGLKVPIQTAATGGGGQPGGGGGYPVIQYEDTGVSTQLSVREGEPTLVGTLSATRPGQLYVIVLTARRTK